MIIMKIRATIPGIGDYEGEMTFESLKDAVKYVEDDMFYGPEKPYMAAFVKSKQNTVTIIATHGGMSFTIIIKEDTATHEELGE